MKCVSVSSVKVCFPWCCVDLTLACTLVSFFCVACQDSLFSIKVQVYLVILYIKNSPQYLRGLFYLFLDHNKPGLSGSNSNANKAYASRSLSQNLRYALGI